MHEPSDPLETALRGLAPEHDLAAQDIAVVEAGRPVGYEDGLIGEKCADRVRAAA